MRSESLRIALVSPGHTLPRQILMEARRRLLRKPGCRSGLFSSKKDLEAVVNWRPHGIIAHVNSHSFREELLSLGLPVVNTSQVLFDLPFPSVSPDNFRIGKMAGDHLQHQGYTSFSYVGQQDLAYAHSRKSGYLQALKSGEVRPPYEKKLPPPMGLESGKFVMPASFRDWLIHLPPRTGLFAMDDPTAAVILDAMQELSIPMEEAPGIVSGHDMDWPTDPTLSSIDISVRRWGSEAGEMMLNWLQDPGITPEDIFFAPGELNQRETTSIIATRDPVVQEAIRFIRDHADLDLAVPDVAEAVGRGRRTLERRFKEQLGYTLLHEINRAHVNLAKQLLRETNDSVVEVSRQVGLDDVNRLIRIFNKFEGVSPGKYRETLRQNA